MMRVILLCSLVKGLFQRSFCIILHPVSYILLLINVLASRDEMKCNEMYAEPFSRNFYVITLKKHAIIIL